MTPSRHSPHLRRLTATLGTAGLFGNGLAATVIAFPLLLAAPPAQAACTNDSGAPQNRTYTYTAATIGNEARLDFPANLKCTFLEGRNLCVGAQFGSTANSGANTATMELGVQDHTHGEGVSNMASGIAYGPFGALIGLGASTTLVTFTATIPSDTVSLSPPGTYSNTFKIYTGANTIGVACGLIGIPLAAYVISDYTANFVIPKICTLVSSPTIDFGTISSIAPTATRIDAQGSVTVRCNTPYTIYIGDGGDRVSPGSGNRRMLRGTQRLPYQLYKDAARTQVWDATGGTAAMNGSGGVSDVGTGLNQTRAVYGSIPAGTVLPTVGAYSDTVVVTITY